MSYPPLIHLCLYHDHRLCLRFFRGTQLVEEIFLSAQEGMGALTIVLPRKTPPKAQLMVFIDLQHVMFAETTVPTSFTEEDIVQLIHLEQATFFPMLDQAVYFDFLSIAVYEEKKKIKIAACNMEIFSPLIELLPQLKLKWDILSISHPDFQTLNLLPWRQHKKNALKRKQHNLFCAIGGMISLTIFIVCFSFMHLSHQDEKRKQEITSGLQKQTQKLKSLVKSCYRYQQLQHFWEGYTQVARAQLCLETALITVERKRPLGLVLEKIQWRNKVLFLSGNAMSAAAVKSYGAMLKAANMDAYLQFMKNPPDKVNVVEFEIFILGIDSCKR